uniref:uncharacterized protein K02A2.6-like n=1 Tax=Styela clava TaxID=7725 RepID=UPI001939D9D6|nr:uncharacterized protein K02A2.6-like [Styela clava]
MQSLYKTVQKGWPVKRAQVSQDVVEYWNYRDEITVCENLLLKGERIIIPTKLRSNILKRVHIAHFGIEKSKSRARDSVFWPNIKADIVDYISKCKTCLKHRRSNQKEPLISHEIPNIPWSTVASDIFYYKGKDYLLVVDYFSKYPEIARLQNKTSYSVISAMKEIIARHGIPEKIVADNMPFNSLNFLKFCRDWEIQIVTSSPNYPRSNEASLSERFVQSIKNLLKKADDSNRDIHLSLLEFRNTPISDMSYSPSELLMSRKLRSKIPVSKKFLNPKVAKNVHSHLHQREIS